jgi:hypothetical protein
VIRDLLLRGLAYLIAATVADLTALAITLPYTRPLDIAALTTTVIGLIGLPILHAADTLTQHLGGHR